MVDVACVSVQEANWIWATGLATMSQTASQIGLSRSLLAPYLCIAVIYIGSGVVEGDVQELESSLHLRLSKL